MFCLCKCASLSLCDGPLGFDKGKGKMVDAGVLQDSQGARAYEGSSQLHGRFAHGGKLTIAECTAMHNL